MKEKTAVDVEESGLTVENDDKGKRQKMYTKHFITRRNPDSEKPNTGLSNDSKGKGATYMCEACDVVIPSRGKIERHLGSKSHMTNKKFYEDVVHFRSFPEPSIEHVLELDRTLESTFIKYGMTEQNLETRTEICQRLKNVISKECPGCEVRLIGSSKYGVGLLDSAVDVDIVIKDEKSNMPHVLMKVLRMLRDSDDFINVEADFSGKRPAIHLSDKISGIKINVITLSPLVWRTGHLLKIYSGLDPRVKVLGTALRHWARTCDIDDEDGGGFTSYVCMLMVTHYLQHTSPPVLPVLGIDNNTLPEDNDKKEETKKLEHKGDDKDPFRSFDDLFVEAKRWQSHNYESPGKLWLGLFKFYLLDFKVQDFVVNIRSYNKLSRDDKGWGKRRFAVEDPFARKYSVADALQSNEVFKYIWGLMINALSYFGKYTKGEKKSTDRLSGDTNNASGENKVEKVNCDKGTGSGDCVAERDGNEFARRAEERLVTSKDRSNDSLQNGTKKDGDMVKNSSEGSGMELEKCEDSVPCTVDIVGICKQAENLSLEYRTSSPSVDGDLEVVNFQDKDVSTGSLPLYFTFNSSKLKGKRKAPRELSPSNRIRNKGQQSVSDLVKVLPLPPMTEDFDLVLSWLCNKVFGDFCITRDEEDRRNMLVYQLQSHLQHTFPGCQLHLFGSSINLFGLNISDLDICMTMSADLTPPANFDPVKAVALLSKSLRKCKQLKDVLCIATAKVPICKFTFKYHAIEGDISFYNCLALQNSRLLRTYARIDDRVRKLGFVIKMFAKVCEIGDASRGSLSSYAYIIMLLHYLQRCSPPVIPVLQELHGDGEEKEVPLEGWNCWFFDQLDKLKTVWPGAGKNRMSCGRLLLGFFRFYIEQFNFRDDVVCIRQSQRLTKFEKMWNGVPMAIEDPFILSHNLGRGITANMFVFIIKAFARGRERFGSPIKMVVGPSTPVFFLDGAFLTGNSNIPKDRLCRYCGHVGHKADSCERRLADNAKKARKNSKDTPHGEKTTKQESHSQATAKKAARKPSTGSSDSEKEGYRDRQRSNSVSDRSKESLHRVQSEEQAVPDFVASILLDLDDMSAFPALESDIIESKSENPPSNRKLVRSDTGPYSSPSRTPGQRHENKVHNSLPNMKLVPHGFQATRPLGNPRMSFASSPALNTQQPLSPASPVIETAPLSIGAAISPPRPNQSPRFCQMGGISPLHAISPQHSNQGSPFPKMRDLTSSHSMSPQHLNYSPPFAQVGGISPSRHMSLLPHSTSAMPFGEKQHRLPSSPPDRYVGRALAPSLEVFDLPKTPTKQNTIPSVTPDRDLLPMDIFGSPSPTGMTSLWQQINSTPGRHPSYDAAGASPLSSFNMPYQTGSIGADLTPSHLNAFGNSAHSDTNLHSRVSSAFLSDSKLASSLQDIDLFRLPCNKERDRLADDTGLDEDQFLRQSESIFGHDLRLGNPGLHMSKSISAGAIEGARNIREGDLHLKPVHYAASNPASVAQSPTDVGMNSSIHRPIESANESDPQGMSFQQFCKKVQMAHGVEGLQLTPKVDGRSCIEINELEGISNGSCKKSLLFSEFGDAHAEDTMQGSARNAQMQGWRQQRKVKAMSMPTSSELPNVFFGDFDDSGRMTERNDVDDSRPQDDTRPFQGSLNISRPRGNQQYDGGVADEDDRVSVSNKGPSGNKHKVIWQVGEESKNGEEKSYDGESINAGDTCSNAVSNGSTREKTKSQGKIKSGRGKGIDLEPRDYEHGKDKPLYMFEGKGRDGTRERGRGRGRGNGGGRGRGRGSYRGRPKAHSFDTETTYKVEKTSTKGEGTEVMFKSKSQWKEQERHDSRRGRGRNSWKGKGRGKED